MARQAIVANPLGILCGALVLGSLLLLLTILFCALRTISPMVVCIDNQRALRRWPPAPTARRYCQ